MKKLLLITGLMLMAVTVINAQTISYDYDASGNRVSRILMQLKSASTATEKDKEPIETGWGERKVTIYPNPTRGNLKIRIEGGEDEASYRYTLFSAGGQVLKQGYIQTMGDHPFPMDQYAPGIYILVLQDKNDKLTFKIMKE
jgi:hypothetical protein